MATETTFFSYSRVDSAFVMKLAKDLRNTGFKIWLDQLDIKPGSRWDDSIQSALNNSKSLIVILSSSSVASENVMDEVSFALGNHKTVIPVLLNECATPFRLSRFQRIDFTGDYQTGLNYLIETLDLYTGNKRETDSTNKEIEHVQSTVLDTIPVAEKKQTKILVTENIPASADEISKKGTSKKYLFLAGGVVIIAIAIWGIMQLVGKSKPGQSTNTANTEQKSTNPVQAMIGKPNQDSINRANRDSIQKVIQDSIDIGKPFRGGTIFYLFPSREHGLIAADFDQGKGVKWNNGYTAKAGAYSVKIGDGKANTKKLAAQTEAENNPANLCTREINGYADWYLPSKDELNELYLQQKQNKVPGFIKRYYYYSSTEDYNADSWYQSFFNGHTSNRLVKNTTDFHVRAIRAF
jgi:TIR domain/Protein of unknown function (DUF1566)